MVDSVRPAAGGGSAPRLEIKPKEEKSPQVSRGEDREETKSAVDDERGGSRKLAEA